MMKKEGHKFQWSPRLGYLSACPSNIGTGLRCSVHMRLENLGKVCQNMNTPSCLGINRAISG